MDPSKDLPGSNWQTDTAGVVELMRELSKQTDPQAAALLYSQGIRKLMVTTDEWMSVSRRYLSAPYYRITRSTRWKEVINPWKELHRLPVYDRGLIGELIYSNQPAVIDDLPSRLTPDDPLYNDLVGFELLMTLPQYDDGESLNMNAILVRDRTKFNHAIMPYQVLTSNLYARSTLNLVLRQQLKEAFDSLDREMKVVAEIQHDLLPRELPAIPSLELAVSYQASRRAGGDYYDFLPLPDNQWGIFMADVSGHGTPAAVVMAITHAIAHAHPGPAMPPNNVLAYINRLLSAHYTRDTGTFVTAYYGNYNPKTRTLTSASAGHPAPRLRRNNQVRGIEVATGLPLGIDPDADYPLTSTILEPDDLIALYTDGITEAFDHDKNMFETHRLDEVLLMSRGCAQETVDSILAAVDRFASGAPAADDRTLLVARVHA